ncbi:hypothetical protein Dsin_012516 [Dipteronia sinensis]|uniref:HAT C-terminal dimerisation domain-containing protein n=1 Tax=Dipteronia sinensis TaxID=43782 RepID=A0AAE0AI83_9ROSI|nr:hypothetical protein Dsin_012516 [Dipteronia sinensis]
MLGERSFVSSPHLLELRTQHNRDLGHSLGMDDGALQFKANQLICGQARQDARADPLGDQEFYNSIFKMASGSGNAPRRSISMKGKGRMADNLGHDDRAYHEYLQHKVYAEDLGLNFPQSHSHPSLRISEPDPNVTPLLTNQSENMPNLGHDGDEPDGPDPNPHQDFDFDFDLILILIHRWKKSYRSRLESLPDYLSVYYEQGLKIDYDVDMCCDRVKTLLYELYDEYLRVYGPSLNIDVPQTQNVSRSSSSSSGFFNLGYFPILAMIAKQILSTPVSTVAVEQQFNAGGNILDPKRSLMSPKSLQIQVCVENWTKAQYRQQEIEQEEPYDFFKDDQPAESRTDDHGND